jgi:outer membrane protein TolC
MQENIKIAQLNVTLSTQTLSLADQRYKSGLNDMVELNDAKLNYTKSKSNFVNIYYNYLTAVANLDYSVGIVHD